MKIILHRTLLGSNFTPGTGEFRAPRRGQYLFAIDGEAYSHGAYAQVFFKVNGNIVRDIYEHDLDQRFLIYSLTL